MWKAGLNDESLYTFNVKQNYIADDVQLLKRKLVNEFLTEIGINNTNLDKRERLTNDEVNANDQEVIANIQHWIDNITYGINEVNRLYDLGVSFSVRDFGGRDDESSKLS